MHDRSGQRSAARDGDQPSSAGGCRRTSVSREDQRRLQLRIRLVTLKAATALLASVVLATIALSPAAADEPGESDESAQLVRQAIALIVNTPGNRMEIMDKVADALDAPRQRGVDLGLVRQARTALTEGRLHATRARLERSIGARPHLGTTEPLPIRETRRNPTMAVGAESGVDVTTGALAPDRTRSPGDWVALAGFAVLGATGVWLALRYRPR